MRSRITHRASTRKNIIETALRERTRTSESLSEPGTSLFALPVDLHGEARSRYSSSRFAIVNTRLESQTFEAGKHKALSGS